MKLLQKHCSVIEIFRSSLDFVREWVNLPCMAWHGWHVPATSYCEMPGINNNPFPPRNLNLHKYRSAVNGSPF